MNIFILRRQHSQQSFLKRQQLQIYIKRQILKHKFKKQTNYTILKDIRELINNKNNPVIIPRNIFQAWHSTDLPNSVKSCIENIKKCNPNFNHYLYDDEQCREFIKEHFSEDILKAYDSIVPAAIKIDLWRYCVLYKYGGIYLDVKYFCVNGFNFNYLLDKEYFCKDFDKIGIYNAIIICKPNNEIMKKCIEQVVKNVNHNFYGNSTTEPTGPLMITNFITKNQVNKFYLNVTNGLPNNKNKENTNIKYKLFIILHFHDNYRNEQPKFNKYWADYWNEKKFYNVNKINPNVDYKNLFKNNINKNLIDVFTYIYENNVWGNNNNNNYLGSSGSGSSINQVINDYVPFLRSFIIDNNIKSVIDIGCGDFLSGKLIYDDLDVIYYGYDAYKRLIDYHNETYKDNTKYNFFHKEIINDRMSIINGDLCILKDILMHWSIKNINIFLDYITTNKLFKYILICNDIPQQYDNIDINDGELRCLSASFLPLKKYNPIIKLTYEPHKEISIIYDNSH